MIDHSGLKELARTMRVRLCDLVPMDPANDPFLAGRQGRRIAAEWFAALFCQFSFPKGVHLRRIHYRLISASKPLRKPDGTDYQNTEKCWDYLGDASRDARYLGLVPSGWFIDRRNPNPQIFYTPDPELRARLDVGGADIAGPDDDFPQLPSYTLNTFMITPPSSHPVEVWVEKTTMDDVLLPLCQYRGVNLITGAGELSETRTRELLERAIDAQKPVRVFYISDFDPAGRGMPVSVSRRIEFYLRQQDIKLDFRLIPLALTQQQCIEYQLPRTPIKETETRGPAFEARFGAGATELDALEALHPGSLRKIVEQAINRYLDPDYRRTFHMSVDGYRAALADLNERMHERFDIDLLGLRARWNGLLKDWESFNEDLQTTFEQIEAALKSDPPAAFEPPPPADAREPDDADVLFDSKRDYLTQCDAYKAWQAGIS